MLWQGSGSELEEPSNIFTGAFAGHYHAPDGFCFDITCTDDPIQDDPRLKGYNLDTFVRKFDRFSNFSIPNRETGHRHDFAKKKK